MRIDTTDQYHIAQKLTITFVHWRKFMTGNFHLHYTINRKKLLSNCLAFLGEIMHFYTEKIKFVFMFFFYFKVFCGLKVKISPVHSLLLFSINVIWKQKFPSDEFLAEENFSSKFLLNFVSNETKIKLNI